ncbi:MAG: hypothetical protein JSU96_13585 [Acidobacteriota bacterium]|nr:MAG: hypothetical protein JSU96_13585 [Acidobacteriota bacterium]
MPKSRQIASVRRFHDLIPYRAREVLLVSSPYDAFILQEDGHLTDRMFFEYREISLSSAPRFTHASNTEEAFQLLQERRFDLIMVMSSLAGMDANAFGRQVKELRPGRPVVLLALDRNEVRLLAKILDPAAIDGFFLWSGDILVLLAIIKFVEDHQNVDHDIRVGNVRVILYLEDNARDYSFFLGFLYKELMQQSLSLYSEGMNDLYRLIYMKSRPKVLHARSYEEGVEKFKKYKRNVSAVISDIGIPRGGELDPGGGLAFARYARSFDQELPLLLQSAETSNRGKAEDLGAAFLDKNLTSLLPEIREFLSFRLGFGDFVFRTPDGQEVDRARDLRELEEKLKTIPEEQLIYHATHNHISLWLMARSEFELAEELRPTQVGDFDTIDDCRMHIIRSLRENRLRVHRGVVTDFRLDHLESSPFMRIGGGYLGGKARGIAFLYQTLADLEPSEFEGLPAEIPQTIVISTDEFDTFLQSNDLVDFAHGCEDDREIQARFLTARLSDDLVSKLELIVNDVKTPLAIRSSSLLEDSMHQPFAGIYTTLMIPNEDIDSISRLRDLCNAIKLVYASTFSQNAKSYLATSGNRIEEEKMAVIIQRLVGQPYGRRFYPGFSGVAQSYNYYPIGPQHPDDGIVHVGLGLGRIIVDGGLALRFSPRHPQVNPQFSNPEMLLESTQRGFWGLDMDKGSFTEGTELYSTLRYFDLREAEADGTLLPVGSVYSAAENQIRDDLNLKGPRVITFNNILKHKVIPLPETISRLLDVTQRGLGCAVEIEFACDMGDWGRQVRRGAVRRRPVLYLLQVRPLASRSSVEQTRRVCFSREQTLCLSRGSLGHGIDREIRDMVYVHPGRWDASANKKIATEVGQMNELLRAEGRPYVLIGPGRWGTADPWLGIPVKWSQISQVRLILEASPEGYNVDPSQGTHFFHNIIAQKIGYLTLPPGASKSDTDHEFYFDWDWLLEQEPEASSEHLCHVRLAEPLTVVLDGRDGRGVIGKPGIE